MEEIIIALAKSLPEDILINFLKDALDTYLKDKSETNRNQLSFRCQLLSIKTGTQKQTVEETIRTYQTSVKMAKAFDNNKS